MKTFKSISLLVTFLFLAFTVNSQYKVGDKVEDFRLQNVDGKMVSLSDYKDAKGFIVVFSCNTCPVVHKYESRIKELHDKYASKGFPVVAINPNDVAAQPKDSFEDMKKRAKAEGFKFAYLRDDSQEVAKRFGAERTPHVYIVSKESNGMKLQYVGAIDNNADSPEKADKHYVKDAIKSLLNNEQLAVNETRAVGCTIKWKK
jgi:peroxiredoxin